ncbi:TetR/AcrR family transcriptional regulator [Amycolatopsis benzoatilytica]|uniref:TetR/AcrR family transcriptional regulator n=1 Tax=Amycolatopsis benzoatilytica TaxID=346045 RepID=UPI000379D0EC|nr:TetR family transcriptional regulator [Amycolatopsis benzoatilytica]
MPVSPECPRSRSGTLTAEKVIDAAVALTVERGLDNWTLRQLAAAIGAYPAVVYHHVGDRDAVVCAVLDRVVGQLELPDGELGWQEWFAELLSGLRDLLRRHPGTARRMATFGPSVEAAAPTLNQGVRMLLDAGFGEESPLAYTLLTATACQFVALEDDRNCSPALRLNTTDDYAAYRDRDDLPGMAEHGRAMHRLLTDPEHAASYHSRLFDAAVGRCLDGLACRLAQLRAG